MLRLVQLPKFIGTAVASMAGTKAEELRAKSISGGYISYHFFFRRVHKPSRDLLLSSVRETSLGFSRSKWTA